MTLARWILRAATHNPPEPLRDWGLAMRREHDEMRGGELGWALGCAAAMIAARMRVEFLFWAMVIATPFAVNYLNSALMFDILPPGTVRGYGKLWLTLNAFAPLPFAALIGLYRPSRTLAPMLIGGLLVTHVGTTLWVSYIFHTSVFVWWGQHGEIYGAPPLIGLAANLAAWYLGAKLGAALRRAPA